MILYVIDGSMYVSLGIYSIFDSSCSGFLCVTSMRIDEHTSGEGHLGYEKCLQGSGNGFWALLIGYFENQLSPKYWQGAFWDNLSFIILGGPKSFFWPGRSLFGIVDPNFGGLHF